MRRLFSAPTAFVSLTRHTLRKCLSNKERPRENLGAVLKQNLLAWIS